jgi:hypothetical protein
MANATYSAGVLSSNSNIGPLFIGNGKVGATIGSSNIIGAESSIITCTLNSAKTRYEGNTIPTFNALSVDLGETYQITLSNQSLDMNTGIFVATATATSSNEEFAPISISSDLYAPRTLPFCLAQTVRLSTTSSNITTIPIYHTVSANVHICDPQFNNNVVYDNITNQPIYILTARGFIPGGHEIVSASAYVFENSYTNMGFNVPMFETNTCFNYFQVPSTTKFTIITATMTSEDFDSPLEEAKRIVLSVINRGITQVRSDHVKAWNNLWQTSSVTLTPKIGTSVEEAFKINTYQKLLKSSLYEIYSCVRAGVNLEVNPSVLGFLDRSGQILYSGDLNLIPLLLLLNPEFARAILDYRYKTLGIATRLAAGYGYKGAKYPFEDDRMGYKNSLYWTTASNMTVFNTATISINVWNYYRVSQDIEWLRSTGYPILKANAEFFTSLIQQDSEIETEDASHQCNCPCDETHPPIHINNVIGISGIISAQDNTFTNALVRMALKYAIEASYETTSKIPDTWIDYYHALPLTQDGDIYNLDAATPASSSTSIPEPLFLFVPMFKDTTGQPKTNIAYSGTDMQTQLLDNLNAYQNPNSTNPIAQYLVGTPQGLYSQTDPTTTLVFQNTLDTFISNNTSTSSPTFNNTTISATFLLMIIQGLAQLNIMGGVASTRFYYIELGISSLLSANMPQSWERLKIGTGRKQYITTNVN